MKENKSSQTMCLEEKTAMRVSTVSITGNLLLSLFKLSAGFIAHSGAMISDAVHSASDVLSTFVVIIGVKISGKPSDKDHPYGHERMECVASIILAVMLALTGVGIGISGIQKILSGDYDNIQIPGILALIAAVVSIIAKEAMYWYTRSAALNIRSGALMADAWHHRSDALSSIGALIGIAFARAGFPVMDPVASITICVFIGKAAYDIFKDACDKMVDRSCGDDVTDEMEKTILNCQNVLGIDDLKTRLFGNKIYLEVEIAVDASKTVKEGHDIAEYVHDTIEREFQDVKHCTVHVNPYN